MYLIRMLGSRLILSNNQSRATLWVLDTCLVVGLLLPFIMILITAHCQRETNQNCRAWLELWFDSWCACVTWCDETSLPVLMNPWLYWIDFGCNGTLLQRNSKDPEPGYHRSVNPRQEKLSQLLLNDEKLMPVSCTSNLSEQMCGFQKNAQCSSRSGIRSSYRCNRKF